MITDFDIDWDGFNSEKEDNLNSIIERKLSRKELLDFAAQMMTERDYAEGLYRMAEHDLDDFRRRNMEAEFEKMREMKRAFDLGKKRNASLVAKSKNKDEREDSKAEWLIAKSQGTSKREYSEGRAAVIKTQSGKDISSRTIREDWLKGL